MLAERGNAQEAQLPDTGISRQRERELSPPFISGGHYGTRTSTVLLVHASGDVFVHEKRFGPHGTALGADARAFRLERSRAVTAERHIPVRYAGFGEYFTMCSEPVSGIKTQRMSLGMQMYRPAMPAAGPGQSAIRGWHCQRRGGAIHAQLQCDRYGRRGSKRPVPIGQAIAIQCQCMNRHGIGIIPFQRFGYLLFDDEHPRRTSCKRSGRRTKRRREP